MCRVMEMGGFGGEIEEGEEWVLGFGLYDRYGEGYEL